MALPSCSSHLCAASSNTRSCCCASMDMYAVDHAWRAQLSCSEQQNFVPALQTHGFHPHTDKSRDSSNSFDAMAQQHVWLPASPVLVAALLSRAMCSSLSGGLTSFLSTPLFCFSSSLWFAVAVCSAAPDKSSLSCSWAQAASPLKWASETLPCDAHTQNLLSTQLAKATGTVS